MRTGFERLLNTTAKQQKQKNSAVIVRHNSHYFGSVVETHI